MTQNIYDILSSSPLVFYDGDCGFCNHSVQFLLTYKTKDIYFLPLQDERAQEILEPHGVKIDMNTIYVLKNDTIYDKSTAIISLAPYLKSFFSFSLKASRIIPKMVRDFFYDIVAKNRQKLSQGYCVMPSPKDRGLFL